MNILIAPDSFKECLSAERVARAIAAGVRRALPAARVRIRPLADGGEGTAEILTRALGGQIRRRRVRGPLGNIVTARWGCVRKGRTALLDMASASGLALAPPRRRNPLRTTSYGTGQLIRAALDAGCRKIFLGVGGSATVDGGLGVLQALGATLRVDPRGLGPGDRPATGADLDRLTAIDVSGLDPRLRRVRITVLCDVTNPLYGPRGAARVFGPQKGATPAQVRRLDAGLRRFAGVARRHGGKGIDRFPGAGAAGGVPVALKAFARARIEPGARFVMSLSGIGPGTAWADLIFTGEGRVDGTSTEGKVVGEMARRARGRRKSLIVLTGALGPGAEKVLAAGASVVVPISPERAERRSFAKAGRRLAATAQRVMKAFDRGSGL